MDKDIKEILAEIKDSINETPKKMFKYNKITFNLEESQVILDCITNLRNEMEILRSAYIDEKLKNDKVIHFICYEYRPQRPTTKEEKIIINILRGGAENE